MVKVIRQSALLYLEQISPAVGHNGKRFIPTSERRTFIL